MEEDMASRLEADWSRWGLTLGAVVSYLASGTMVFGGVLPYIPQYREISRTQDADGFSLYVCLALLVANTLRILFWFGKQFETTLLVQSCIMNVTMFIMIELCVRTKRRQFLTPQKSHYFLDGRRIKDESDDNDDHIENNPLNGKGTKVPKLVERKFWDLDPKYFWEWTDFVSYVECMAAFTVLNGILMYSMLWSDLFVESVGFLALTTEALLGTPQLVKNFRSKSTQGMNYNMVLLWTVGDLFKTGYFVVNQAPLQFLVCGILQVAVDLFITGQVILYKGLKTPSKKVPIRDYRR
jgi:uncharacterized protein with PQ loop repeat